MTDHGVQTPPGRNSRSEALSQGTPLLFDAIPDPAEGVAKRPAPHAEMPSAPSLTRGERAQRTALAAAVGAAWIVVLIVRFGLRDNVGHPLILSILAVWTALSAIGLGLAVRPLGRGMPAGARVLWGVLAAIPAAYLAVVIHRAADAAPCPLTWRSLGGCFAITSLASAGPMLFACLVLRRTFLTAPVLRGAAVGLVAGMIGAIVAFSHCPIEAASHLLLPHGLPIVLCSAAGALFGARWGRV